MNFLGVLKRRKEQTCPLLFGLKKKHPAKEILTSISKKASLVCEVLCEIKTDLRDKSVMFVLKNLKCVELLIDLFVQNYSSK